MRHVTADPVLDDELQRILYLACSTSALPNLEGEFLSSVGKYWGLNQKLMFIRIFAYC